MTTFFIALAVLVLGYVVYGKFVEKVFGIDPQRATPATTMADGVDYVPMKPWRIFLIQFLNIAGVGPIIGAIMGAQFGTASFLWIVLGSIFAGAVHDYLSGMISLRDKGASLPEIHGTYLGKGAKQIMRGFTVLLMVLVGVVFVNTPATLLNANFTQGWNPYIWIGIILAYYLIATLLPIDKVIGKIYPIFGILLLGMAVAIFIAFLIYAQSHLPDDVYLDCLRCHFGIPCHAVATDGALHGERETRPPDFLRRDDYGRHRCPDLGRCRCLFLRSRQRG